MIGRNVILLSSLALLLLLPGQARALGVSDATTHIYLSEQVKQLTDQFQLMQAQLDEALKANETLTKSYEAITGTYGRVTGVYDDVMSTKAFLNDSYNTVMGQYEHFMDLYEDISDPNKGDMETIKDLLEGVFKDPRLSTPKEDRKRAEQEYQLLQEALKKAIGDSEDVLASMPDRMAKINELGGKVGKGEDMKESQALTNSILIEILTVLQEQLAMSTRFQQAMGLSHYSGVTEKGIQARAEAMKKILTNQDLIAHETKILETYGVSVDGSLKEMINNLI